jgi:putative FmdB family regulatory protein
MPIYEYSCSKCDLKFDLLRPMSQANEGASCPRCCNSAERVPSAFASFSKGSDGDVTPVAGGSSCSGCSASSCASCH